MTTAQFPPLVCASCSGTGRWDVGTEEEGPCGADYCHEGVLVCQSCADRSGDVEPAVGTIFVWRGAQRDDVVPLCRMHLQRAHAVQAAEDRGDYERDMRKDGGW